LLSFRVSTGYVRRLLITLALSSAAVAFSSVPASAQTLACGDVVTSSVTLQADLLDCPGDGLVVGASGITIDLNGHTIAGRYGGDSCTSDCLGEDGIDDRAGYDRVTVRNGTIRTFGTGVVLAGVRHSRLSRLTVVARGGPGYPRVGVSLLGSQDNLLDAVTVTGGGPSLLLSGSDRNTVAGSTLHGEVSQHAGDAVQVLAGSDHNRLAGNTIDASGAGLVLRDSRANVVAGNSVDTGLSDAVTLTGATSNVLRGNTVSTDGPTWAIRLSGNLNLLDSNRVTAAYRGGIEVLGALNALQSNRIVDAGINGDAIAVGRRAWVTFLAGNVTSGAGDDGIDVDGPTTLLRRNTSTGNGDLGIEAIPGTIDLGGNRASGNGNPLQCQIVTCTAP
jgi:parallel beta-helix repeat protein